MSSTPSTPNRLFVFDFDWTLIEADSDHWVFEQLCKDLSESQLDAVGKVQWTDLQQMLLGELYNRGVSRADIERALSTVPFTQEMMEALRLMKSQGGELYILSDANTVYIETILKAYNIQDLFAGIITNPAAFNETGRLNVKRFHGLDLAPHGCSLPCQPNLCKGRELQKLIDSRPWEQVVYMGDGANDFCPSTRLSSHDLVLARKGLMLEQEILARPELIKADIIFWESTTDVLNATRTLLNPTTAESEDSTSTVSSSSASSSASSTLTVSNDTLSFTKLSSFETSDSKLYGQVIKA